MTSTPAGYAALWFGFLGAPAAWSISELVSYILMAHACYPNLSALPQPDSGAAWPAAVAVTACMLVISLAALAVSWRETSRLMAGIHGYDQWAAEAPRSTARRFLAFGGVLFSTVFAAFVVYNLIALIFEPACRVVR